MNAILEDLAAGRIDAAEAARRIDALPGAKIDSPTEAEPSEPVDDATPADSGAADSGAAESGAAESEPVEAAGSGTTRGEAGAGDGVPADEQEIPHPDAWAATTDRPQTPGAPRDTFRGQDSTTGASAAGSASKKAPKGWAGRSRTPATGGVERLSVRAVGRRVRIVGEPSVATVSADGPHVLRRNGSVLEISSDGEFGASIDGFQLLRATRSLDDFRSLGLGKELLLRVNPALLVDVEVTAGSLNTEGVPRLGSIRVTAGGARLLDVSEIADALVQAGQATVKAAITTGRSRIRVESGSLNLQLSDASNVTISTDSQLGKVSWGGAHAGFTGDEVVMGNGSAKLDVEVVMGHAAVKAGTVAATSGAA
ncbi:hypothetical protein GJV80_12550 [Microlunatus sp. Gsoil 973]|jgi:hypothetical protein|nr:hypothetical protein GJV80_12550 [Microlunatus sp. Gsoil 973]